MLWAFSGDGEVDIWHSYRLTLVMAKDRAIERLAKKAEPAAIDAAIEPLLQKTAKDGWEPLYEVEQRLLRYMTIEEVRADFARRVVEAEKFGVGAAAALKQNFDEAKTDEEFRALHTCLIEDIHFRYAKRRLDRRTRNKVIASYILAGLALIVIMAMFLFLAMNYTAKVDGKTYNIVFVMLVGLIGAYFSRLTSLNANTSLDYDTLMLSYRFRSLVLRGGVGMLAAVVFYYLIYSGLVSGDIFPDRDKVVSFKTMFDGPEPLVPSKETAKFVVWSFLSGFSERLVSGTLDRLEQAETARQKSGAVS